MKCFSPSVSDLVRQHPIRLCHWLSPLLALSSYSVSSELRVPSQLGDYVGKRCLDLSPTVSGVLCFHCLLETRTQLKEPQTFQWTREKARLVYRVLECTQKDILTCPQMHTHTLKYFIFIQLKELHIKFRKLWILCSLSLDDCCCNKVFS